MGMLRLLLICSLDFLDHKLCLLLVRLIFLKVSLQPVSKLFSADVVPRAEAFESVQKDNLAVVVRNPSPITPHGCHNKGEGPPCPTGE